MDQGLTSVSGVAPEQEQGAHKRITEHVPPVLSLEQAAAMQDLKPEAAYFYPENGKRACLMVFDMKDPSQIPVIAERFFMELNAEVTLTPVMNADDLKKGLEASMMAKSMA